MVLQGGSGIRIHDWSVGSSLVNLCISAYLLLHSAQALSIQCEDDRQKTVRLLCRHGSQVGQGANENSFGETTEADRPECCKGAVGQAEA